MNTGKRSKTDGKLNDEAPKLCKVEPLRQIYSNSRCAFNGLKSIQDEAAICHPTSSRQRSVLNGRKFRARSRLEHLKQRIIAALWAWRPPEYRRPPSRSSCPWRGSPKNSARPAAPSAAAWRSRRLRSGDSDAATPATRGGEGGRQDYVGLGRQRRPIAKPTGNQEKSANDARLLSFDFIAELGEHLAVAGMAMGAAATAENIAAIEMSLRHARAIVCDAVAENRRLAPRAGPNPRLIAEAARDYHKNRGGRP